ncbi:MAG TPA: helix-turn-helix transcriptional regulator [Candidatus Tumulicola sp.]|nr:helix-turn-helix transcriptional regulator [Candidatus Tumulicola sp.]
MLYSIPNIGETIRRARKQAKLSQAEVARRARLTQAQVSQVESGADLRYSTLLQLVGALDLEPVLVPRRVVPLVRGVVESATS